ncbi:glycosyltransferase [Streptococcus halotolerans]|uniref:glycosyltransferase n=1 Tax=Streptococcus halotolerans TaxID=1814128 RepID=UPI0007869F6F|nr:glycosyltransferase [Streptococcus halotolerans]
MVKTAVLMATFNGQSFITDQLDSIRQQTLAPDYVLIRDDGSTDNTLETIENYIKKHQLHNWKIIRNEKNLGWRLNFRQLLEDAKNLDVDYLFFSDQDDVWYLDKNEKQISEMIANPDISVLSGDIDINVISTNASVPKQFQFEKTKVISIYPKILSYKTYRPGWTLCFKKSFSDTALKHWQSGDNISHDNLFSIAAAILGKAANLNTSVGIHRRYENNASGNAKYIFNIKSTKEKHIEGLYVFYRFYETVNNIYGDYNNKMDQNLKKTVSFYKNRYEVAKANNTLKNLVFIFKNFYRYNNLSALLRDFIFSFKK